MAKTQISELTDIPQLNQFLALHGLEMTGWLKAGIKTIENGYPKEIGGVWFNVGDRASAKKFGIVSATDDDLKALAGVLAQYELPDRIPYPDANTNISTPPQMRAVLPSNKNGAFDCVDWEVLDEVDLDSYDERKDKYTRSKSVGCLIRNASGQLVAIEERWNILEGGTAVDKGCVRWFYFSDFKWRPSDPNKLPMYGMEQLNYRASEVAIHEGPKAAYFARHHYDPSILGQEKRRLPEVPWHDFNSTIPHLGILGGVNRISEVDFGPLKAAGVKRVYYLPDNDDAGRKAAYELAGKVAGIEVFVLPPYPDGFPRGWDFADGFQKVTADPSTVDGMVQNFLDITRMTREVSSPNGPKIEVIPGFPKRIAYVERREAFYQVDDPFDETLWEKMGRRYAPHIHQKAVNGFAGMITESQPEIAYGDVTFAPEQPPMIIKNNKRLFNLWRGPKIDPKPMSEEGKEIWETYLNHLIPDAYERKLLERWLVTVVARPARKLFGVILHGDEQGTGKTLLFEEVLRPLIGEKYVYAPKLEDLTNKFNGWRLGKVLIYADELKGVGKTSTADIYNMLKTDITSTKIRIEKKMRDQYEADDHSKTLVNSNMDIPLFMEASDRRWLVCGGSQKAISDEVNTRLRNWLRGDGLAEVYGWCLSYREEGAAIAEDEIFVMDRHIKRIGLSPCYLPKGADAPMTAAKMDLIRNSKSRNQKTVASLLEVLGEYSDGSERPVVIPTAVTDEALRDAELDMNVAMKARYGKVGVDGWWFCDARQTGGSHVKPHRSRFTFTKTERPRYVLLMNDAAKNIIDAEYPDAIETLSDQSRRYNPKDGDWVDLVRVAKSLGIYTDGQIFWSEADGRWKMKGGDWPDRPDVVDIGG